MNSGMPCIEISDVRKIILKLLESNRVLNKFIVIFL